MQTSTMLRSSAPCGRAALRQRTCFSSHRRTALRVQAIAVGDMLPDFELQTDDRSMIKSQDMVKDSGAVIFIYPKANTSGCTHQACGFNENLTTFEAAGYKIFGLSADTPEAQAAWKKEQGYNYPLLCDPDYKVLPALCGAAPGSKITRTHIIVDQGGRVMEVKLGVGSKESVPDALMFLANAQLLKKVKQYEEAK